MRSALFSPKKNENEDRAHVRDLILPEQVEELRLEERRRVRGRDLRRA